MNKNYQELEINKIKLITKGINKNMHNQKNIISNVIYN